ATCDVGFSGSSTSVACTETGDFVGEAPACKVQTCDVPASLNNDMYKHTCRGEKHGSKCSVMCGGGFKGEKAKWKCIAGNFSGALPTCTGKPCKRGRPRGRGVDASACKATISGESCAASCKRGYTPTGSGNTTCTADGWFTPTDFWCQPALCGNLSNLTAFQGGSIRHNCDDETFGGKCLARCARGYKGSHVRLQCDAAADTMVAQGFIDKKTGLLATAQGVAPICLG
ncbi:unnamed protein product, partial [Polarella glacialis]